MKRMQRNCLAIALCSTVSFLAPSWAATKLSAEQLDGVVAAGGLVPSSGTLANVTSNVKATVGDATGAKVRNVNGVKSVNATLGDVKAGNAKIHKVNVDARGAASNNTVNVNGNKVLNGNDALNGNNVVTFSDAFGNQGGNSVKAANGYSDSGSASSGATSGSTQSASSDSGTAGSSARMTDSSTGGTRSASTSSSSSGANTSSAKGSSSHGKEFGLVRNVNAANGLAHARLKNARLVNVSNVGNGASAANGGVQVNNVGNGNLSGNSASASNLANGTTVTNVANGTSNIASGNSAPNLASGNTVTNIANGNSISSAVLTSAAGATNGVIKVSALPLGK